MTEKTVKSSENEVQKKTSCIIILHTKLDTNGDLTYDKEATLADPINSAEPESKLQIIKLEKNELLEIYSIFCRMGEKDQRDLFDSVIKDPEDIKFFNPDNKENLRNAVTLIQQLSMISQMGNELVAELQEQTHLRSFLEILKYLFHEKKFLVF